MKKRNMKYLYLLIFLFCCICLNVDAQIKKVMTYNIRFNNPADGINKWDNRKSEVVDLLQHYSPCIFGIQEGLEDQVNYVDEHLKAYARIGVGRDDGKTKGEYCAIFYKQEEWNLLKEETFWLSPTSNKVSVGWDASMERICTYGLFENKMSNQKILVFNAHYDHIGKVAREESSKLILRRIAEINENNYPVVLMGDFNALPSQGAIKIFIDKFQDGASLVQNGIYGPTGTFTGFKKGAIANNRIDYIFTKKLIPKIYIHVDDKMKDNNYLSDHLPVIVEFE